jgi:hypothetical protein
MTMKRIVLPLVLATVLALAACSENKEGLEAQPIDQASAALTTKTDVKAALTGLAEALQKLEDSALLQRLADALGGGGVTCSAIAGPDGEYGEEECFEDPAEIDFGLEDAAGKLGDWLDAAVFDASQVEVDDGTQVIVLLKPDVFCKAPWDKDGPKVPAEYDPADDGATDQGDDDTKNEGDVDDECVEFLTKVPVRLKFQQFNLTGLSVGLLIGEERVDPLYLHIRPDGFVFNASLAKAREAALIVSAAYAEDGEVIEIPQVVEGTLEAALEQVGEGWTVRFAVVDPVVIDKDLNGQHSHLEVESFKAELGAAGDGTTISWGANLGAVRLSVPYQWIVDAWFEDRDEGSPTVTGNLDLESAPFDLAVEYADATQTIKVTTVGRPGPLASIKRDAVTLLSAVFNPDNGVIMAEIGLGDTYQTTLRLAPHLDLSIEGHLAALAADLPDLPRFLQDETFRVLFNGADVPALTILDQGIDEVLKVTDGTLEISSTAAPDQTVGVPAGMCLYVQDEEDTAHNGTESGGFALEEGSSDAEHELLSQLKAGECQ